MSIENKKAMLWDQQGNVKIACDAIVIHNNRILMIKRSAEGSAFPGYWALPGGGLDDTDETLKACICREVREETNVNVYVKRFLFHMDKKDRDPRFRAITCVWLCGTGDPAANAIEAGDDADEAKWIPLNEVLRLDLAFDHWDIIYKVIESGDYKD